MLTVTNDFNDVREVADKTGKVVLYFSAVWCGPCKALKPQYAKASVIDPETNYFLLDVDEMPDVAAKWEIQSIPTVYLWQKADDGMWETIKINSRNATGIVDEIASHAG